MFFGVMPVKDDGKHRLVTTTCTYCGVGCNFDLIVNENKVVGVASNPKAPVNGMHTCVKGRYGFDFIHHSDRLRQPKVRRYLLEGGKKSHHGSAGSGWKPTGIPPSTSRPKNSLKPVIPPVPTVWAS